MNHSSLTHHALEERLPSWGVLVLESHHSSDFEMEWRTHPFLKLVYVLRGRGVIEISDRVVHFQEGDLICVPAKTANRITDAPDAASSLYVCCVDTKLFSFAPELLDDLQSGLIPGGPHLSNRVAAQLRRLRHEQSNKSTYASIAMVAGALRLVEWVARQKNANAVLLEIEGTDGKSQPIRSGQSDRERVRSYVDRLKTEFYEATTIDDAAKSIRMSRRTFTKLFSDVTGVTWLSYVRKLSIDHAKHQLAQTDQSITSIAFEAGFNDLSTFYRQFKSQTGMTPRAYRKSIDG